MQIRRLREDDRAAVSELDRGATGEDRSNLLDALHPLAGVAADRSGTLAGWAAKAPYGAGIAICAGDDEAGVALMAAAANGPAPATLVIPDANAAAMANLRRWGFRAANAGERMRLGPAGGLAAGASVRALQPVLGVEGPGHPCPSLTPTSGAGPGTPAGSPRGREFPSANVRMRTFLNPVYLAAARDRNQVPARSSKWRATNAGVDRLEQALADEVVDVGEAAGAQGRPGRLDVVLRAAQLGLAVGDQQPDRRRPRPRRASPRCRR